MKFLTHLKKFIAGGLVITVLAPLSVFAQATIAIPPQPGNAGKFLTTDGLNMSWTAGIPGSGTITSITAQNSITATPNPITNTGTINLVNDSTSPGNSKYYGTNGSGTKGFFDLPGGGGGDCPNALNLEVLVSDGTDCQGDSLFTRNAGTGEFSVAGDLGASPFDISSVNLGSALGGNATGAYLEYSDNGGVDGSITVFAGDGTVGYGLPIMGGITADNGATGDSTGVAVTPTLSQLASENTISGDFSRVAVEKDQILDRVTDGIVDVEITTTKDQIGYEFDGTNVIDFFSPTKGSIVLGDSAGNQTFTGEDNLLLGGNSDGTEGTGVSLTTGEENILFGRGAGRLMQASSRNVVIGSGAASSTGSSGLVSDNVIIGRGTGTHVGLTAKGGGNVLIGQGTGTGVNANYAVGIGYQALGYNTADSVIAIGFSALSANTSGVNIGIGDSVGQSITTGTGNILIGSIAGQALVTNSSNNTIIGFQAGTNNEGNRNTFIGSLSGQYPLGNDNTAIGYATLTTAGTGLDQTIQRATVLGSEAMTDPRTGANDNTAIGYNALNDVSSGYSNTVLGSYAGAQLTTGDENVMIGAVAGYNVTTANTNIFIGTGADSFFNGTGMIALGASAVTTASNQMVVGSTGTPVNDYYFGEGVLSATPGTTTFNATGGTGTDIAGGDFVHVSGRATGNALGGSHIWQTSDVGVSGTTLQTATTKLTLNNSGLLRATNLHDNATAQGDSSQQDIRSGTYTPTLTGVTNVTSTTSRKAQWLRVGNVVTVSGQFDVTPTGTGTVVVGISLPVASNFGTAYECGGAGHAPTVAGHGASVYADATNNRAELSYVDTVGSADVMTYTFTYEVI